MIKKILVLLMCAYGVFTADAIELPAPTGKYFVGQVHISLADKSRTMKPSTLQGPRLIAARVYYPIDNRDESKRKPYLSKAAADYLISTKRDEAYRMPTDLGPGWETQIVTHTYLGQAISKKEAKWPILIYTHGLNSLVELGQSFIEDIVSHGFIVVAFETTNISGSAVFPDGKVVYSAQKPASADFWTFVMSQFSDVVSDFDFILSSVKTTNGEVLGTQFKGKIDLNSVGAFGISFGGGAAIDFAARNPLVKAAINLDGSIFETLQAGKHNPKILHILSEGHKDGDGSFKGNAGTFEGTISYKEIPGSKHENFGDTPYLLKEFNVENNYPNIGPIDPFKHIVQVRAAILAHFLDAFAK